MNQDNGDVHEVGLAIRREVLGDEYVDRALAVTTDFDQDFQRLVTEYCWGAVWGRDGLPRKTRSLLNIAMMAAINRPHELRIHARAALRNGCTVDEVQEVLMQVAVYCGIPAGLDGLRTAREAMSEAETE